ncbi:MAG: metallophosphoesterase [Acidimicrobiia bacterium]
MIRVAAVGDVHAGLDSGGCLRPHFEHVSERADVLLLAGDLTRHGDPAEAAVLVDEVRDLGVPTVAVLGNHDHHSDSGDRITGQLLEAGICVLEGESTVVAVNGATVGVAGSKGFGGGFAGACATDFGEPQMKAFIGHTRGLAERLGSALGALDTDVRIALLHYSPVEDTLRGERLEIYPFLGSYLLAEAIDRVGADLVVHGHAHAGVEKGMTPGGVHVRNVAQPVIKHAYHVYCLGGPDGPACD